MKTLKYLVALMMVCPLVLSCGGGGESPSNPYYPDGPVVPPGGNGGNEEGKLDYTYVENCPAWTPSGFKKQNQPSWYPTTSATDPSSTMTITASPRVALGKTGMGEPSINDLLAVFQGDQCRGVASPQLEDDVIRYYLMALTTVLDKDVSNRTLTLRYYNANDGLVYISSEFPYNDNGIGSYAAPFNPEWVKTDGAAGLFVVSFTLPADVISQMTPGDKVALFADGVCRGVISDLSSIRDQQTIVFPHSSLNPSVVVKAYSTKKHCIYSMSSVGIETMQTDLGTLRMKAE